MALLGAGRRKRHPFRGPCLGGGGGRGLGRLGCRVPVRSRQNPRSRRATCQISAVKILRVSGPCAAEKCGEPGSGTVERKKKAHALQRVGFGPSHTYHPGQRSVGWFWVRAW